MGWLRFDDHPDQDLHEGFVRLMVQQPLVSPYWLPVGAVCELDFGRRAISSDELVMGVRLDISGTLVRRYQLQVACECGWASPLLPVPLSTEYVPCTVEFGWESDSEAAADLWGRLHRDRLDEWPASLAQAWPKAAL